MKDEKITWKIKKSFEVILNMAIFYYSKVALNPFKIVLLLQLWKKHIVPALCLFPPSMLGLNIIIHSLSLVA